MLRFLINYNQEGKPVAVLLNRGTENETMWASLPFDPVSKVFSPTTESEIKLLEEAQSLEEWATLDLSDFITSLFDLASAKLQVQQQVVDLAAQKQEALTAGYSDTERDTWDRKEQEAQSYLKYGNLADAKYLKAEAEAMVGSGATDAQVRTAIKQLASVIIQKADQMRLASAVISGTRARKWQEVNQLQTIEQVLAYEVESGWEPS